MNPDHPNPDPGNPPVADEAQAPSESGCGILPQSAGGASRPTVPEPASTAAPHPPARSFVPDAYDFHMALELTRPEETRAEPDYDYEEDVRERELFLDDLASDSDDFHRSAEEGWFYSDED